MSRAAVVSLTLVVCIATAAAAASAISGTMNHPDGPQVVVEAYGSGVMRLQVLPAETAGTYVVTDVVVAKPEKDQLKKECAGEKRCTFKNGDSALDVSIGDDDVISATFTVGGEVLSVLRVPNPLSENADLHFTFPQALRLYGIPEHAVDLALKQGPAYRLMNLDVFHYKLDDPGGIYGTIPFLMAHGAKATTGVLVLNSADGTVTVSEGANGAGLASRWNFEVGPREVFFFPGKTPMNVQQQHASITGPTLLPPLFALGYHQCRWNYRSTNDCLDVDRGFDLHNIPYDVLWLDIEHTDVKKYFTWDFHNFPEPQRLANSLSAKGRKMVTITDPHIKRESGYHVHDEAAAKGFYVQSANGGDYEGHCWPGTSSWVDFYNSKAREWYATLFKYDRYLHSTKDVYTWIDMNEPSVFNSPEVTMDKNAVHRTAEGKTVKHRFLHNMYGFYHTMAAFEGHMLRNEESPSRPFILTRSFFAGSQRYAAMWTGDNMARWDHLDKSLPMLLTLSLSNYIFVGADVGGFFFDPEAELMVRWYQAGIFYPFFRGHAHLETKRREPWLFGEENTDKIRDAISLRYSLLPYLYTAFYKAHVEGTNVIRPLFFEFPHETSNVEEQRTYMFGPSLLVRPVTTEGAKSVSVELPLHATWFNFFTGERHAGGTLTMPVTLDTIPVFIRGGHIVPTKERLRRSTAGMYHDPLTLYVAVNDQGNAAGQIYLDDTDSFKYANGAYLLKNLVFTDGKLTCRDAPRPAEHQKERFTIDTAVERIVVFGLPNPPKAVVAEYLPRPGVMKADSTPNSAIAIGKKQPLEFRVDGRGNMVIRKPDLLVDADWTVAFE